MHVVCIYKNFDRWINQSGRLGICERRRICRRTFKECLNYVSKLLNLNFFTIMFLTRTYEQDECIFVFLRSYQIEHLTEMEKFSYIMYVSQKVDVTLWLESGLCISKLIFFVQEVDRNFDVISTLDIFYQLCLYYENSSCVRVR